MATSPTHDQLRAMAEHRGLKLLRSRKRKPGVGDFGKFGLTDAKGKALLGIDKAGLNATAQEVEDYLRGRALGTWKLSAETTSPAPPAKKKRPVKASDEPSAVRRRAQTPVRNGATETKARQHAEDPPKSPRFPARPVQPDIAEENPKAAEPSAKIRPSTAVDAPAIA